jgi:hypothetical protein
LIPIEVKSNDKDNIPKIFKSFDLKYWDRIKFFIRTTKSLVKIRDLNWKKVYFLPAFLIGRVF